jgi:hypothetical protein
MKVLIRVWRAETADTLNVILKLSQNGPVSRTESIECAVPIANNFCYFTQKKHALSTSLESISMILWFRAKVDTSDAIPLQIPACWRLAWNNENKPHQRQLRHGFCPCCDQRVWIQLVNLQCQHSFCGWNALNIEVLLKSRYSVRGQTSWDSPDTEYGFFCKIGQTLPLQNECMSASPQSISKKLNNSQLGTPNIFSAVDVHANKLTV